MKIKTKRATIEYVKSLPKPKHKRPIRPWWILRTLVRILSIPDLWATKFTFTKDRMESAGKGPYLILMNHSSFIDLKIASKIFYPHPYCIVSTTDSFIGKGWLMKWLGCIPTQKFVSDITLITDMIHALKKKNISVLMYPEAGYSFDGRATMLPAKLGTLIKKLDVPVLSVITDGAFLRQPLYNNLRLRKVKISAHLSCMFSRGEIQKMSVAEIDEKIAKTFSFDNFKNQYDNKVVIDTPTRAEGLHRILYRCPECNTDGSTKGIDSTLICHHCGAEFKMDKYGRMQGTEFAHIPDWVDWERQCVKNELADHTYRIEAPVDIGMIVDSKALYMVGSGRLVHNEDGFTLSDNQGNIVFEQSPTASFTLNSDFYWYQIADIICIGDKNALYYCFLKDNNVAFKARLATEELYKLKKNS